MDGARDDVRRLLVLRWLVAPVAVTPPPLPLPPPPPEVDDLRDPVCDARREAVREALRDATREVGPDDDAAVVEPSCLRASNKDSNTMGSFWCSGTDGS